MIRSPWFFEINETACAECLTLAKEIFKELSIRMQAVGERGKYVPSGNSEAQRYVTMLNDEIAQPLNLIIRDPQKLKTFMEKLENIIYKGIIGDEYSYLRANPSAEVVVRDKNNGIRTPKPLSAIPTPMDASETLAGAVAADYSPVSRKALQRSLNEVAFKTLRSTLAQDKVATDKERRRAAQAKENEARKTIFKGEPIIIKGEKVTPELLDRLKEHERALRSSDRPLIVFWADFLYRLRGELVPGAHHGHLLSPHSSRGVSQQSEDRRHWRLNRRFNRPHLIL